MREESIHRFDIYEDSIEIPLDPIHCESIMQRSALHNWTIAPHQHEELLHIFYLGRGSGTIRLDLVTYEVETPSVMIIPARTVHGFTFGTDIDGYVLTLHRSSLDESLGATAEVCEALSAPRMLPADIAAGVADAAGERGAGASGHAWAAYPAGVLFRLAAAAGGAKI